FFSGEKPLNCHSNIQFGMGGAGTFSDGKLSTGVKDPSGRNRKVLEIFVECGADPVILYDNKPHLGTDELVKIVKNMGEHIESLGGEIRFNTEFTGFTASGNQIESITLRNDKGTFTEPCNVLVLAIGHSARNTFYMLNDAGLDMEAKSFAVGVRAEHNQHDINNSLYGEDYERMYNVHLPAADYKLTYHAKSGRSVYSFCMCPGGFVVNASSEEGRICVNGMSYKNRDSENANSAIIVSVNPEDTGGDTDPLNGIEFQRRLEEKAFEEGKGAVPYQLLKDFTALKPTEEPGFVKPLIKGLHAPGNLNNVLPDYICNDIKEAFTDFGKKIKGFDDGDTVLSAVESRTSSPVRILRDENMESSVKGIMPIGEGAGYAGGIVSAAMDGLKAFEKICSKYSPVKADTL
ncbi:MAG: FAD-dependent oxidoreductase, partial [Parasporobacterium sp.]|nr:FAD-dependent oxidoreductase [Parasporobacterium sp.]